MQNKKDVNQDDLLRPRYVINTSVEPVTIKQDPQFIFYIKAQKRRQIKEITIEPGELAGLPHFYMIPTTKSGRECSLIVGYSIEAVRSMHREAMAKKAALS